MQDPVGSNMILMFAAIAKFLKLGVPEPGFFQDLEARFWGQEIEAQKFVWQFQSRPISRRTSFRHNRIKIFGHMISRWI